MLDHVLIPLDFSDLSEKAVSYGLEIVSGGGQVTLLTVIEPQLSTPYANVSPGVTGVMSTPEPSQPDEEKLARDYLKAIVHRLPKPHPTVELSVQTGGAAEVIVDTAKNFNANAIVMSTHGRAGLSRWVFGSVTQKVLAAAPCPVFVIPSKAVTG